MTRLSLAERAVMGLARTIAVRERRCWMDAMEAELAHLPARRASGGSVSSCWA